MIVRAARHPILETIQPEVIMLILKFKTRQNTTFARKDKIVYDNMVSPLKNNTSSVSCRTTQINTKINPR